MQTDVENIRVLLFLQKCLRNLCWFDWELKSERDTTKEKAKVQEREKEIEIWCPNFVFGEKGRWAFELNAK